MERKALRSRNLANPPNVSKHFKTESNLNMKSILLIILVFLITSFSVQENNIEGLKIRFKKVSEKEIIESPGGFYSPGPNIPPSYRPPVHAIEGMKLVKLNLILKNEGTKDCNFNFDDVYISTEQDSLYQFDGFGGNFGFNKSETVIKPQKEIKRIATFLFPENAKPKELFIENRRFKIIEN